MVARRSRAAAGVVIAAGPRFLDRWAGLGAIRAIDAAIARQRLQKRAAALAVIKPLAGIGRHDFSLGMAAFGAGDVRCWRHCEFRRLYWRIHGVHSVAVYIPLRGYKL